MSQPGDTDLLTAARSALLDALQALQPHLDAVVVIGAQAIYLHTGAAQVALAETTKDSDLALDTRALLDTPLLENAMLQAGFRLDPDSPQPGSWLNPEGIPVDLMVPESLAGSTGRRGVRIPPHSKQDQARIPSPAPRHLMGGVPRAGRNSRRAPGRGGRDGARACADVGTSTIMPTCSLCRCRVGSLCGLG
jgi:hypothetical protein